MSIQLKIDGMTCAGCVKSVTNVLRTTAGTDDVTVDLASGTATVGNYAGSSQALVAAVERAGFEATVEADTPSAR